MPPPLQKSEGGVCTQAKNRLDAKRCCDSEYYLGYEYNEVSLNILQILTEIELFSKSKSKSKPLFSGVQISQLKRQR